MELLELLSVRPHLNTAALLEHWRDDERGPVLDAIAASRMELDEAAIDGEFGDAIAHLIQKARQARAHELLSFARERELTVDEVLELKALTAPEPLEKGA